MDIVATNSASVVPLRREASQEGPAQPARVGLSALERLAVTRLVEGTGASSVAELAVERATALATDGGPARRRCLARAIAVAESQLQELQVLLAGMVARRETDQLATVDRLVTSATRRLCSLIDELRAEETGGRRSMVVVGAAQEVSVRAP